MVLYFYCAIFFILVANFILERWLDYLNTTKWSLKLPVELEGIYNEEKFRLSMEYEKTKHQFAMISESVSFVTLLILFAFGGFGWLDGIVRSYVTNPILVTLVYFAILGVLSEIFSLPFKWYDTFRI